MTGVYATTAILAALHDRHVTGRGCHIDASLFDVQVAMLAKQASNELIGGTHPTRMGNAHPNIVPYQVFATRDGHMVLAVGNDGQFERFCLAAGHPDVAKDPAYATNPARVKNRQTLVPLLATWLMQRDTADWGQLLDAASVPCSPILDVEQVMKHPHVLARGMKLSSDDPAHPPMIANPMLINGQRMTAERAPPALGADEAMWRATT
jgi:crotonobetainyl-CoA:carnitine CoA-transferase CaiB-like acyl-CoA transferase